MATQREELEPDFLRMDGPSGATTQSGGLGNGQSMGWPSRNVAQPKTIVDDDGRITRVRTPVMDLEGLMTPTHLFYVVQHFAVPEPVAPEHWRLSDRWRCETSAGDHLRDAPTSAGPDGAHRHGVLWQRCQLLRVFSGGGSEAITV